MKKALCMMLAIWMLLALAAGCTNSGGADDRREENGNDGEDVVHYEPVDPVTIEIDTIYEDYDVTNDGKPDSLGLKCLEPWEYDDWAVFGYHWQILINGEAAMEIKTDWPIRPEVELYQVSDDLAYLSILQRIDTNDDIADYGLYLYDGGTLEKVCDFYCTILDDTHIFHYGAELVSVAADRIVLRGGNQFNATAYLTWDMEFAYQDGQWDYTGNVFPVVYHDYMEDKADGMTANQELTVYTATDCEEVAYLVPKGGVVTIDKLCIENGGVYFHVTNEDGVQGWLRDPQEVYSCIDGEELFGYFEEAIFAG